jgi:hypothetical protein
MEPIRTRWKRARLLAATAAAGLILAPAAAIAATAAPASAGQIICLTNSPGCGAELTAQGAGAQAQLSGNGANITVSDCGLQQGNPVRAWRNANNLWVHAKSDGTVTFENDSTNGCNNNADKWIKVPNTNSKWNSWAYGRLLWTNTDGGGELVYNSNSPGWVSWSGGG